MPYSPFVMCLAPQFGRWNELDGFCERNGDQLPGHSRVVSLGKASQPTVHKGMHHVFSASHKLAARLIFGMRVTTRLATTGREMANFSQVVSSQPITGKIKTDVDRVGIMNGRLPAFGMNQPTLYHFLDSLECHLQ